MEIELYGLTAKEAKGIEFILVDTDYDIDIEKDFSDSTHDRWYVRISGDINIIE